jgi:hypothetical protein
MSFPRASYTSLAQRPTIYVVISQGAWEVVEETAPKGTYSTTEASSTPTT